MVQSPSWEANWFAVSQEIPRISRNPKVHYHTHKRLQPVLHRPMNRKEDTKLKMHSRPTNGFQSFSCNFVVTLLLFITVNTTNFVALWSPTCFSQSCGHLEGDFFENKSIVMILTCISYVYRTVHHCDSWRIRDQLDVTIYWVLFHFFYAQHVSDINTSINRSLQLFYYITTLVVCSCLDMCWSFGVAVWGGIRPSFPHSNLEYNDLC